LELSRPPSYCPLEIQEKRAKADELLNILVEDPEVLQLLERKIIEKRLVERTG